ncbi:hypothetical protein KP509_20G051600 [Ceratopteris richardii]|nr:hypothetical protein KP509_20G051600 [Ceratopteris richardii]
MLRLGMAPCSITYLNTLQACIDVKSLTFGREVHNAIVKSNMESDIALASCLIDMYCKCCSVVEARRVFDFLPKRNIVSWGSMISGYVQQLHSTSALELFADMQQEGIDPDPLIYCDILKAYGKLKSLEQGKLMHKKIASSGLTVNAMLMTSLIDFYGKCGRMEEAHAVFEQSGKREEMLWSALLTGYVENEQMGAALMLYECMLQKDICPNTLTFLSILRACASLETLVPSRLVHDQIIKAGLNADLVLATVIIDVYVKLSSLGEGCSVLETLPNADTVSWTTLILGYAERGEAGSALELLDKMQQSGVTPDSVSFLCLLKACSSRKTLMLGRLVHDKIIRFDFLSDLLIGNALVDMYVMCGNLEDGHNVLDDLPSRTVVSWSTLISGYVEINDGCTALQLFEKMQHDDIEPNEVTLLYMLKACAITGVLETGKWMHDKVIRKDMMHNMLLGSCVVEMYAVCGSLEEACRVFDLLPFQDAVSWGAMISGYAQNGCFIAAVKCLSEMQQQGLKANAVVFASILTACCNVGFVYEGWRYLMTMHHHFGIEPGVEHYSCMVDLLGRTGYLSDAARLLESMPVLPNIIGWTALLGSCRRHGNMDLAMQCFNNALKLDLIDASSYLLLSSIFNDYQTQELEDFMPDQRIDWGIR